jgi:Cdc6-like AAA superfamily ATPase
MFRINKAINKELNQIENSFDNTQDIHTIIHPEINFTYNSLNLIVGNIGSGKTRYCFREIGKLKYAPNNYHMVIYVADEEGDRTVLQYGAVLNLPLVRVDYDSALEYINRIIETKRMYEELRNDTRNEGEWSLEQAKEILHELQVKNFQKPFLHTIVVYDDATDILTKKKNSALSELIMRNRHGRFTYFLNVHDYFRTIPPKVKSNLGSLVLFGGYSKQKFDCMFQQFKSPVSREELFAKYQQVGNRDIMLFCYFEMPTKIKIIRLDYSDNVKEEEEDFDDSLED